MVYRPGRLLPKLYKPDFLASFLARKRLAQATQLLRDRGCRKVILYLWRPDFETALDLVSYDLSCYHIDDEYTFSETEQTLSEGERRLISRAGQVFIHSPALLEKKGRLNPHTTFVPNGVDYRAYAMPQAEPEDLKAIPHPRVGYVGVIKSQLDFDLLVSLANRHRNWSFVLVGPRGYLNGRDIQLAGQLSQMANVYFVGGKPVEALPAYTQHVDVCIMCYRLNDYTKYIYPMKLHEYLATGRPVVGAPINSLQAFSDVVTLAQSEDEWSAALSAALQKDSNTKEKLGARQMVARRHDWEFLVHAIASTMCARLGPAYQERFKHAVGEIPAVLRTGAVA
jgi:glycosyltransferase involved in cell wall biosynthesis